MRNFFAALVLAFTLGLGFASDPAAAQSLPAIYLGATPCGLTRYCGNVPNSTGDVVSLSAAYGNFVRLSVNGVTYSSAQQAYVLDFDGYPLIAPDGTTALLTARFLQQKVCVRSGRGQHCSTQWTLVDGSIIR
jgi:hypothetical protein